MIETLDSMGGQKWARFTLIGALVVSIGYNVANICLTQTDVHVLLRIPQGIVWPAFLFLGIEVMIRNKDLSSRLAKLARLFLMGVTVPTAVTSYINLHDFMVKANEPGIAQVSGPLAIDGLMLGCTLYLLASRFEPQLEEPIIAETAPALVVPVAEPEFSLVDFTAPREQVEEVKPVSPAAPRAQRAPRAVEWDVRKAAEMAVDGEKGAAIAAAVGISPTLAGRFVTVARKLRADPGAEINASAEKVRPEGVRIMKELISR